MEETEVFCCVSGEPVGPPQFDEKAVEFLCQVPGVTESCVRECLGAAIPVNSGSEEADWIVNYLFAGQEHDFGIQVLNIVRITRCDDMHLFICDPEKRKKRRMLLWHGTKTCLVADILRNGFKLPTGRGQMFGQGIYFADRASKRANYCETTRSGSEVYLWLCDVAVGRSYNTTTEEHDLTTPPDDYFREPFDSVKGIGENIPDEEWNVTINESIVPLGPSVKNKVYSSYPLRYNEYILYDPRNVEIKYLVKVKFTDGPIHLQHMY